MGRILVVDDDPLFVGMLADVLGDEGHEVVAATRSLRALDRAREARPDLILMDVMMPYLDGLDQLRLLRLDETFRGVPVIVVTAKPGALDGVDDPRALGVVDCVSKPFELPDLLQRIDTALAQRQVGG